VIAAELEATVPASAEAIWRLISDARRLPQWLAFADKVEVLSGEGVGMTMRLFSRWRDRKSEVDVEVTAFEPERLLGWRHLAERVDGKEMSRFSRETRFSVRLEPFGEDTTVRLRSEQDPAGPLRGFAIKLFARREALRRMALSLQRLKMVVSVP